MTNLQGLRECPLATTWLAAGIAALEKQCAASFGFAKSAAADALQK